MDRMRRHDRGYTAVEVLVAMTLFAVGAAGVIGMQRATVQAGAEARRFDIATHIANQWIYRLQRDAIFWTVPNNGTRVGTNLNETRWLKQLLVPDAGCNPSVKFCTPTIPAANAAGVTDSAAADILGRDVGSPPDTTDNTHFFCTQFRLQWIASPTTSTCSNGFEACVTSLARVEVRVFWKKLELTPIQDCAAVDPDAAPNDYHFVYVATGIRENANEVPVAP